MDRMKKKPDDEMLIVHKPPEPDQAGREPEVAPETEPVNIDAMTRRVLAADAERRPNLLRRIQQRFGNATAARVVESVHRREPPNPPAAPGKPA